MRNHSQRSRNRLARDGGRFTPMPGSSPRGAKNREMKPASSSMPSDWYPEKSRAAETKDRKQTKHTSRLARGQRLSTTPSDAASPIQVMAISMLSVEENQRRVGASHQC